MSSGREIYYFSRHYLLMRGDFDGFMLQCGSRVREFILSKNKVLVIHHYDADGLSSAGVVANALERAGKSYSLQMLKKLDDAGIEFVTKRIAEENFDCVLFVDLGSGQNALLEKSFVEKGISCAVIDHHVPQKKIDSPLYCQANCMDYGFDGGTDASAASTAFYVFVASDPTSSNWDLVQLAIVGAVGDVQDTNGLVELNQWLVKEGVKRGLVAAKKDLRMFGRVTRTLVNFLRYCTEPILPGLTGDEKACALFLHDKGIPLQDGEGNWLHYNDLSPELQKKLVAALANHLVSKAASEETLAELVGEVYEFPLEDKHSILYDGREYSTLFNACGRHDQIQAGIDVALRKPRALEQAQEVLSLHRSLISRGMSAARSSTSDLGPLYFLDGRGQVSDTVIGTVIGNYFNSGLVSRIKPIIGFSLDERGQVKASGRGSKKLVTQGLDLNEVMRAAAEAAGGLGGGHKIAAGASFPPGGEDAFLRKASELIRKQLAGK